MLASYLESLPSSEGGASGIEVFLRNFRTAADRLYRERGVMLPTVHVQEQKDLERGQYRVLVREEQVRSGSLDVAQRFLVAGPSVFGVLSVTPIRWARHPLDFRGGAWVSQDTAGRGALESLGVESLTAAEYLICEAIGSAFQVVDEIFGVDEVKTLLASFREHHKLLVEEVFEKGIVSFAEFTELLRRLIRERVSIRDIKLILEGISEFASLEPEPRDRQDWLRELHAFLRKVLARSIVREAVGPGDKLRVFVLSSDIEEEFRSAAADWDGRREKPPVDPAFESQLRDHARRMFHPVIERGSLPVVVLCAGDIRPAVQEFFSQQLAGADWLRTIAYQELDKHLLPEAVGVLSL